jgi:hypothetical protein
MGLTPCSAVYAAPVSQTLLAKMYDGTVRKCGGRNVLDFSACHFTGRKAINLKNHAYRYMC